MPLHPSAAAVVQMLDEMGLIGTIDTSPDEMRARMDAGAATMPPHPLHSVADRTIPGPAGDIPVRVYRRADDVGMPILVWFHGGGWVIGSLDSHDQLCRLLADDIGCAVVSVDYRLAPEAKFPAAVDDCLAAYEWVRANADVLGGDGARVAIGGDSAGGNLAAVLALVAREQKLEPPRFQLLVYPVTDHEFESASMIDNAAGFFLETERMRWFFDQYARTTADHDDWRLNPMRARDVSGLAPAMVVTAEFDPLRDQGEAYGRRILDAGGTAELIRCDGMFHGFFGMHAFIEPAKEVWDRAVVALRDALEIT
ncbi:MAG: alpha/beta hydrolase [Actinomycetota bacterium]